MNRTCSTTATSATKSDFDPSHPFIGSDGLEYADFAARIVGEPKDSWRNKYITKARARGTREIDIRTWIKAYDIGGTNWGTLAAGQIRRHEARANHRSTP